MSREQAYFESAMETWSEVQDSKWSEEKKKARARRGARRRVRRQDELLWALYRVTDLTQLEAAKAAIVERKHQPTQGRASQIYRQIEDEILIYCERLNRTDFESYEEAEEKLSEKGGCVGPQYLTTSDMHAMPELVLDSMRQQLAETIVAYEAWERFKDPPRNFPEWAGAVLDDEVVDQAAELRAEYYERHPVYGEDTGFDPAPAVEAALEDEQAAEQG
jgi:hypothetical protein